MCPWKGIRYIEQEAQKQDEVESETHSRMDITIFQIKECVGGTPDQRQRELNPLVLLTREDRKFDLEIALTIAKSGPIIYREVLE
jgi:hypothetical protein